MLKYRVFRADGTEVQAGETLTSFRGKGVVFHAATHPRKVSVRLPSDTWYARDGYTVREFYPSVYGVEIRSSDGYVWHPVSEVGKTMPTNMEP